MFVRLTRGASRVLPLFSRWVGHPQLHRKGREPVVGGRTNILRARPRPHGLHPFPIFADGSARALCQPGCWEECSDCRHRGGGRLGNRAQTASAPHACIHFAVRRFTPRLHAWITTVELGCIYQSFQRLHAQITAVSLLDCLRMSQPLSALAMLTFFDLARMYMQGLLLSLRREILPHFCIAYSVRCCRIFNCILHVSLPHYLLILCEGLPFFLLHSSCEGMPHFVVFSVRVCCIL
jgi:hypothetical protein